MWTMTCGQAGSVGERLTITRCLSRQFKTSERESDIVRKAKGPTTRKNKAQSREAAAKDDLFAPREFGLTKIS